MYSWWRRAQHLAGLNRPRGYCVFCSKRSAPYPTVHDVADFVDGKCYNERDPMQQIFETRKCPDCGGELAPWHDMGHDVSFTCLQCRSAFGVQTAPFYIVERIRDRLGEQGV